MSSSIDIWQSVFKFMNPMDYVPLSCVSKTFKEAAYRESLRRLKPKDIHAALIASMYCRTCIYLNNVPRERFLSYDDQLRCVVCCWTWCPDCRYDTLVFELPWLYRCIDCKDIWCIDCVERNHINFFDNRPTVNNTVLEFLTGEITCLKCVKKK